MSFFYLNANSPLKGPFTLLTLSSTGPGMSGYPVIVAPRQHKKRKATQNFVFTRIGQAHVVDVYGLEVNIRL